MPASAVRARHPVVEVMSDRSYAALWTSSFLSAVIFGGARFAWVWVVLEETNDAGAAALAGGFALGLPNLFISLPAGAYADRFDRRKIVLWASVAGTIALAVTAVLASADRLGLLAAVITAAAVGCTTAVVQPIHSALVPQLVPARLHLTGVALQNLSLQSSFFIGALVSGALIQAFGAGVAFGVMAFVQTLSGVAMLAIRPALTKPGPVRPDRQGILASIWEGLRFSMAGQPLRSLNLTNLIIGFIGASMAILLPQVARDELGRDAFGASALVAAVIPGMVVMTLFIASRPGLRRRGMLMFVGLFAVPPMLIIPALTSNYWLALANVVFWGTPMGLLVTLLRQLIQEATPDVMMGRVMSVVHVLARGTLPLASLVLLVMTRYMSAADALIVVGVGVIVAALVLTRTRELRQA